MQISLFSWTLFLLFKHDHAIFIWYTLFIFMCFLCMCDRTNRPIWLYHIYFLHSELLMQSLSPINFPCISIAMVNHMWYVLSKLYICYNKVITSICQGCKIHIDNLLCLIPIWTRHPECIHCYIEYTMKNYTEMSYDCTILITVICIYCTN